MTRSFQGVVAAFTALAGVAGCGASVDSSEAAAPPSESAALPVGRACAITRSPEAGPQAARVLVEVAELRLDPARPPAESGHVDLVWSAHQLATDGRRSTLSWSDGTTAPAACRGAACRVLEVLPHVDSSGGSVRLELTLEQAGQRQAHTTVVVRDQQLVMVGLDGERGRAIAVTPYVVGDEAELRQLFACKQAARAAAR